LLENQYTYKYIAQATGNPNAYGTDSYGANEYSCAAEDQLCLTGGPSAPNTGFFASSNPVMLSGVFIGAAIVVAVIVYAVLRKIKKTA